MLVPGDRLVMRSGAIASLTRVDTSEALAWQTGILKFRDVTLGEAIAELNRYSETKLRVDDPALAAEHFSGAFPAGDQDMFAETLKLYLPVDSAAATTRFLSRQQDTRGSNSSGMWCGRQINS